MVTAFDFVLALFDQRPKVAMDNTLFLQYRRRSYHVNDKNLEEKHKYLSFAKFRCRDVIVVRTKLDG